MLKAFAVFVVVFLSATAAKAQDSFWVQIAARPTLSQAQDLVRDYARRIDAVEGYFIGSGFYGIAIGPFDRPTADARLRALLNSGAIPSDSFVTNGGRFQQQFWPIGGTVNPPRDVALPDTTAAAAVVVPVQLPDETLREARVSEGALPRASREELQLALQWAGFYSAAIDGSFGRGTRSAMESWQIANNEEPTGVLTTRQRATLLTAYNAVLEDAQMRIARDPASGIEMQVPTALVAFTQYQPPFVKFAAIGDVPEAQVLFISQTGDASRLRGLYEVMQILDIVPLNGERSVRDDRFVIEGIGNGIHSYTTATLQDGEIKGFTLVWPEGDEQRRTRILQVMQDSFARLEGTLDPEIVPASADQSIDMVAGLSVRQPKLSRSGFYVSQTGVVATTSEAVAGCERVTFDRDIAADVTAVDPDRGIALLTPQEAQTPIAYASFDSRVPRLRTRVAVAGFPFDGALADPTLTFGEIADLRSLTGDERLTRLALASQPGDAGGPLLGANGDVMGMLASNPSSPNQVLPPDVSFALKATELMSFMTQNDIAVVADEAAEPLGAVGLASRAADLTVLVSCW